MSDEGEKTCPLCAEEMDLTDQQLKPCKCGYEICVWCWHHIMDMAEKDNTEGRCPACRTPYNKEKIVGTASKCERLVTGMSVEKKQKSQKGKTKTSEGRKQLGSVRVIQRNLVYIVGLPLNLADEDLLQQKEYFGQYGKVLKVSISRTAAGAIQQSASNTCSVYITYSKEEEAVRSIQSAHGFVLEGRPLRACFGTTKYCHAWLRNAPCTNADCLYLHEFGPQEDSFTKDEIISAYTRNRVQQVTGATNDMQRRSGNLLPPPADDYSNNSTSTWGKPISRSPTNNPANSMKVSPPNSSSGSSVALPAAASWGTRAPNSPPHSANLTGSSGPVKKYNEESHSFQEKDNPEHPVSMKKVTGTDHRSTTSEIPVTTRLSSSPTLSSHTYTTSPKDKNVSSNVVPDFSTSPISRHHSNPALDKDMNRSFPPREADKFTESLALQKAKNAAKLDVGITVTREPSDFVSDLQKKVAEIAISEAEQDLLSFNDQRLKDTEVVTHGSYVQSQPHFSPRGNNSTHYSPQQAYNLVNGSLDPPSMDQSLKKTPQNAYNIPVVNGYLSNLVGNSSLDNSSGHSYFHGTEGGRSQMGIFEEAAAANGNHNTALDLGENSIISNILSMDFDPWDDSLSSPQNLAKLLGENDKKPESHRVSSSRKVQNSNQSRFSFARQDESVDQGSNFARPLNDFGPGVKYQNFSPDFVGNNSIYLDNKLSNGSGNRFSSFSFEEPDHFASNYSPISENKISASRAPVSAPPGFSGPSRAPPPGFTPHERMEQPFENLSGNHMFDTLRKAHQAPSPVNTGDIEFMDPAILAVGGRVPDGRLNSFENDTRLQLLMQRSFSQRNPRDGFPQRTTDSYIPSRNLSAYQQTGWEQPRSSLMANSHWDGWNELQSGNDIAMAELLRNERLGFNRYYSGHEDTKFRLPTSGNLYNRTFGI